MLVVYFALLAIASGVSAAPSRMDPFDSDYFISPFQRSYSPGFAVGAYSGFSPRFAWNPFAWVPFFPPPMELPKPWYEGDNVCEEKKVFDPPDVMKEWMSEGFSDSGSFTQESETCHGDNKKYICMQKRTTNEGMKMEMTKKTCCFGFVRAPNGPGCVETSGEQAPKNEPTAVPSASKVFRLRDKYQYSLSDSSSRSKSGVDTVPIQ